MPSTPLRRRLRSAGHGLDAFVHIGKEGTTDPVCRQLHQALDHHELVKVKIGTECPEDRFAVAERLAAEPGVEVAQILGRTLLLYKRNPDIARFG
jgi:RNA-binding protein